MGRILLHGSARTTPAIRTEIKELYNTKKLKVKEISGIFNISRPTVYKWIKRKDNKDLNYYYLSYLFLFTIFKFNLLIYYLYILNY